MRVTCRPHLVMASALLAIVVPFGVARAPKSPYIPTGVEIVTPGPNQVLSTHQIGFIQARLVPTPLQEDEAPLNVEMVAQGDTGEFEIGRGDLRSFASAAGGLVEGRWNLDEDNVPSGNYIIRVSVQGGDAAPVETVVPVTVNRAPEFVDLVVIGNEVTSEGRRITFRAITTDDDGDEVTTFRWYPGDRTEPDDQACPVEEVDGTDTFTHTYPISLEEVRVGVIGYDERGGMFMAARPTSLTGVVSATLARAQTQQAAPDPNDCGCKVMNIRSKYFRSPDGSETMTEQYCADPRDVPAVPYCQAEQRHNCGPRQVGYRCVIGPFSPDGEFLFNGALGWMFEVQAWLSDGTKNPNRCEQGQIARGSNSLTIAGRGVPSPNPAAQARPAPQGGMLQLPGGNFAVVNAPNAVPAFNANNYGGDNYHLEWLHKRHQTPT